MTGTITIPGPETLILFGVQVKVLSAIFGIGGVLLGHLMAPIPAQPLGWRRQSAVVIAGVLLAVALTIATGQRPLVVLGWAIGIGFAGITVFQTWGAQAASAARKVGSAALDDLSDRLDARKDAP
ncbi:hypothetical protein [Sphingomonas sp.]|uniref:hypothetical protein n=1 Tax=Sphingomonas sp. TaxID=28214 RepID=UPI002EDA4F07